MKREKLLKRNFSAELIVVSLSSFSRICENNESQLIASFFSGNQQAYWQLWTLYDQQIYRYCLTLMGNNIEDAEDAKQEIMFKGFVKLHQYRSKLTSVKCLLLTIARHTCIDILRRKQTMYSLLSQQQDILPSRQESPENWLMLREEKKEIETAIDALPCRQNYVLIHYYLGGVPHQKIAETLNIKPATSRKHLERGLKKLRKKLCGSVS